MDNARRLKTSKPRVQAMEFNRQAAVIDTHQVEQCGMKIANMNAVGVRYCNRTDMSRQNSFRASLHLRQRRTTAKTGVSWTVARPFLGKSRSYLTSAEPRDVTYRQRSRAVIPKEP